MISDIPQSSGNAEGGIEAFCRSLLAFDWTQPDGPIRFSADLVCSELSDAELLVNARIFLTALAEAGGTSSTATGNLTRSFVGQMFEQLQLEDEYRESILAICKVVNEMDLMPLHIVRLVSECAGLVARRNKKFVVTKAGKTLLPEAQAGELFRKLFIAYFRRFDLHYIFHVRDAPGIQETMAVIFWRLNAIAQDWTPVRGLAPQILLPAVYIQLCEAMISQHDTEEWILSGYVLEPLHDFGLIENKAGNRRYVDEKDFIRVTPLWRKFMTFSQPDLTDSKN